MNKEDKTADFRDIQGIFRFAHGHLKEACFLFLNVEESSEARQWLAKIPVTSAEAVSPLPKRVAQIAFTAKGLRSLELDPDIVARFSDEFIGGMTAGNRSRRLGDTEGNAPALWDWGGELATCPDVLLMLYADQGVLSEWEKQICSGTFRKGFSLLTKLESKGDIRREPFGFADGISQPKVDWHRKQSTDKHDRAKYSNLLSVGEILLGYPNEYGEYTDRPLLPGNSVPAKILPVAEEQPEMRDLGRNGGYLVFRELEQDVTGFWKFIDREANGESDKRERLAEAMVGRSRDGHPLVAVSESSIPGVPKERAGNSFTFDSDSEGKLCPIGAHIRRSNPRTGDLPPGAGKLIRILQTFGLHRESRPRDLIASTRFHRLLRRGRRFGPELTPEQAISDAPDGKKRGLNFIALVANISRQFEFVQSAWIANTKFGGVQDESDPLLGNRRPLNNGTPTDGFSMPQQEGPCRRLVGLPRFITVRGGAYFFAPGLSALRFIAGGSTELE